MSEEERDEYVSRKTGKVRRRRKDGWARRDIDTFLAHYRMTGNITASAAAAGKGVRGVFALRDIDAGFAADMEQALQDCLVRVRSKAIVYAETQGRIPPAREDGEPAEAPMETFDPNFALKLLAHERERHEGFRPKGGPRPKCISKEALVQTLAKLFDMAERRSATRTGG